MSVTITGDASFNWCVYVLDCDWKNAHQYEDAWVHAASEAEKRVYVGSTNNLDRRMNEHMERTSANTSDLCSDGSVFTQKFEPRELLEVHYFHNKQTARRREEEIAHELKQENPCWFVFQA